MGSRFIPEQLPEDHEYGTTADDPGRGQDDGATLGGQSPPDPTDKPISAAPGMNPMESAKSEEMSSPVIIRSGDYNLFMDEDVQGQRTAVGYVRASTEDQYLGPEDQQARIEAWCVAYGHDLMEVYVDLGVSGGVPLEKRPEGAKVDHLIHPPKRGKPDVKVNTLVVTRLDRLTRDAGNGYEIIKQLSPTGRRTRELLSLVALDEHIDLSTAFGRFAAGLRFQFANFEKDLIGERTSDALQHKRRTGKVYGATPYGWRRDGEHLNPDRLEQNVLSSMRRDREQGKSYAAIAARLNTENVPTKRGGTWHPMTVYQILNDPKKEIPA